ncbi:FtsK/SpoIIIE domain-containing protein [Neobacillus mesonae]|uniref:FtsK/SpoIIIE domain-containing protein n=1 Tax=Neobacillus mesonae TaxID=1193713 RepID=UPI002E1A478F|nr:FtsK/SpoIIIE domain-containing protein [Neobacillus mesonae]MED4206614.1 FtsK/SpoIIIE domain-containing protein [Neobacillus mesonae]
MNIFQNFKARSKLVKAFREGGIYKTIGSDERKIFPKIHCVPNDQYDYYVFTLPNGVDPNLLKKRFYVFQQIFGDGIYLDGEFKKFTLTIKESKKIPEINYDYPKLLEIIKKENILMPIVCGGEETEKLRIYDATNSPNLLIYGEPGSGKSSILHVILSTLTQYYSPSQIEFYLADFKMSELNLYEGVEHVKSISYLTNDFGPALKYLKKELTKRGQLLKDHKVRHINKLPEEQKPPYIVLCVDEFVMIKDDQIMTDLLQIASLGRAYGIYLILSMQRPSHKILSTDVRGLLSVRMGFRTVDKRNAMIGETPGSEKISKEQPGTFLLNLDELAELRAPFLNEEKTEEILGKFKNDAWVNHNYKKSSSPDKEELKEQKELTEKDVFNDAVN